MKMKTITLFLTFLTASLLLYGCATKEIEYVPPADDTDKTTDTTPVDDSTDIDDDLSELDNIDDELNMDELDNLDKELEGVNW